MTIREEAVVRKLNAELQAADERRRAEVNRQMDTGYLFDAINRDNSKHESTRRMREAVSVQYRPVRDAVEEKMYKLETGWGWFLMGLIVAGLGLAMKFCWGA